MTLDPILLQSGLKNSCVSNDINKIEDNILWEEENSSMGESGAMTS
jgi:hypothetical protein